MISSSVPASAYAVHRVLPDNPRFVVICTTPLAAAVPYNAAAAGPLMISMFSISAGFRSSTRVGFWPPTLIVLPPGSELARTPSMRMMGSLVSDTELDPRIRIREPPPVVPLVCVTVTLGAREDSRSLRLLIADFGTASALMVATALPVSRRRSDSPVAATTTSSSRAMVPCSVKSAVAVPPDVTFTVARPAS